MRLLAAVSWGACDSCGESSVAHRSSAPVRAGMLAWMTLLLAGQPAFAQTQQPAQPQTFAQPVLSPQQTQRAKLNQDTLIVAASRPGATYLAMANDLVAAIGASGSLRILPIAADGGLANLQDLLYLRGVDLAIVPANVLAYAKATDAFGSGLAQRVVYVTPLYGEEVHIIVGRSIASIDDLRGKRIAVPLHDGTAQFTAKDIFQRLGASFESVPMEPADAVEGVRSGTVAAALLVAGKPVTLVSGLPKDGSLRLLSLPFLAALGEGYSPAVLLAEDYPALLPPGAIVETIAIRAVLIANNEKGSEETARRIAKHVPTLFNAISRLAVSERHPKWKEVNLGAVLPGWSRAGAAELWLKKALEQQRQLLQGEFDEFLRARRQPASSELSVVQRRNLFKEFQGWARKSTTIQPAAK